MLFVDFRSILASHSLLLIHANSVFIPCTEFDVPWRPANRFLGVSRRLPHVTCTLFLWPTLKA